MNNVYQLLEKKGLVTQESILAKGTAWSTQDVIELNTGLDAALREDEQQYNSNSDTDSEFRFFASASFRGDSGCDEPRCRAAKTRSLSKYAALYSDQVIVPVRVSPSFLHESANRLSAIDLLGTILCLWELRPLVEAGVIRLIPTSLYLCESCSRQFLSQAATAKDSIVKLIQGASKSFSVYRSSLTIPAEFPGIVLEISPGVITGYVRDIACLVQNPKAGAATTPVAKDCLKECVRGGSPLVILSEDGLLYVPISTETPDKSVHSQMLPYAGKYVKVSGKLFERGGLHSISIEKIEAISRPPNSKIPTS